MQVSVSKFTLETDFLSKLPLAIVTLGSIRHEDCGTVLNKKNVFERFFIVLQCYLNDN